MTVEHTSGSCTFEDAPYITNISSFVMNSGQSNHASHRRSSYDATMLELNGGQNQSQASSIDNFHRSNVTSVQPLDRDETASSQQPTPRAAAQISDSKMSLYMRLIQRLEADPSVQKEVTLGKRIGLYLFKGNIGNGNFSQVKLALHCLTKEEVAVKVLNLTKMDAKTQRLLRREVSNMSGVEHPNIIRFYEEHTSPGLQYIVMEWASGGELFTRITSLGKLSENEARPLYAQLVSAVHYLHKCHIVHRDLKAENVFFSSPRQIKLGDFGFSTRATSDDKLTTFCGSPPYAAPELFQDEYYSGPAVDVWALGVLLYFIVTGLTPFRGPDTVAKLRRLIISGEYSIPPFLSTECQLLIKSILVQPATIRATLSEIIESNWLDGEEFPMPYTSLSSETSGVEGKTNKRSKLPHASNSNISASHKLPPLDGTPRELTIKEEVHRRMYKLGIAPEDIISALGPSGEVTTKNSGDCSNNDKDINLANMYLVGIYRILLHKIQRRRRGESRLQSRSDGLGRSMGGSLGTLPQALEAVNIEAKYRSPGDTEGGHTSSGAATRAKEDTTTPKWKRDKTKRRSDPELQKQSRLCCVL